MGMQRAACTLHFAPHIPQPAPHSLQPAPHFPPCTPHLASHSAPCILHPTSHPSPHILHPTSHSAPHISPCTPHPAPHIPPCIPYPTLQRQRLWAARPHLGKESLACGSRGHSRVRVQGRAPSPPPAAHPARLFLLFPALGNKEADPNAICGALLWGTGCQAPCSCAPATHALSLSPSSLCHPELFASYERDHSGYPTVLSALWCVMPKDSGCPGSAVGPESGARCPGTGEHGGEGVQEEEAGARAARVFSFVASWLAGSWWRGITEWESVGCATGRWGHWHHMGHLHGTGHLHATCMA